MDIIITVRSYLSKKLEEPVYSFAYPISKADKFYLVSFVGGKDEFKRSSKPTIQVCAYAKNLQQGDDQTQPDLETIKSMTDALLNLLDNAIIKNIAITSISPTLVSDPDIRYFYNSLVCETFSVKSNK